MRILFLSQLLPLPLDAGPKVRSYFVLRHLVEAGHEVTLACFVRPQDSPAHVEELRALCGSVEVVSLRRSRLGDLRDGARSLLSNEPFLILRDHIGAMRDRLRDLERRQAFDAVHADQLWMAPYARECRTIPLRVLDQHNAVFRVPERLATNQKNPILRTLLRREARNLERYERETLNAFQHVAWVSTDDRDAFPGVERAAGQDLVIPIAVDTEGRPVLERPRPFRVTFLGGIHWPPNAEGVRWFVQNAWPAIARAHPEAVLTIIGKGASGALGVAPGQPGVDVTGYLPDEALGPYLSETGAFIVPLLTGAGMRVKILDAWSWGLPIVSTTIGAEGVRAHNGENLLVADTGPAFAERVSQLLSDPVLAARIGRNGRATVEQFYDWRRVYQAWTQVYH